MSDILEVTTTLETAEQAEMLAEKVVQERLAACVQITGPITSVYSWQGKLCKSTEYRCTIKTIGRLLDPLMEAIRDLHPYDVAEILATPVVKASSDYVQWMLQQLREP
ncbi:MAG: divalent-cation tolerance protein CutA [bacterium]|nr:divalent-cation tolerance protein CutA [bacterium]